MMLKLFLEINSSAVDNHVNHSSEDEVQQYEKQGDVGNIFMILFNLVHKAVAGCVGQRYLINERDRITGKVEIVRQN
ncbi:uncharacterized protein LOC113287442 isoform X2 [Papaver somniferum]|uniref:uncharacterized protein LOC113287442 isoform X2 n=1 Tax=Papaver somniferum TaxID=3469 RepID=UPI000E6FB7F2|nr:uncharacterized protein LOC113287442 isoform X2 [Papaver somniferum]